MGYLSDQLSQMEGYMLREKANIYLGATMGTITPIIAARYILKPSSGENILDEALLWAGSLAINFSPVLARIPPLPIYGLSIGAMIGTFSADNLKRKRLEEKVNTHSENNWCLR